MGKLPDNNKNVVLGTALKTIKYLIIFFAILYIGVIIGYSVIGKGELMDAINLKAIRHIINIILT